MQIQGINGASEELCYRFKKDLDKKQLKVFTKMVGGDFATIEKANDVFVVTVFFNLWKPLERSPAGHFTPFGFEEI